MAHGDQINPRMLLVINMDLSVTTNDLYDHFKDAGEVIWARVTDEFYVKSVAQGYVSFAKPEDADMAIAKLDKSMIKGRAIRVSKSSFTFNHLTVSISDDEDEHLKTDEEFASIFSQFGPLAWIRQFSHQAGERYLELYFEDHQGAARAATALKKGQFLNDFMALHCIAQVDLQQEREILRQGEKKLEETLNNIRARRDMVNSSIQVPPPEDGGASASSQLTLGEEGSSFLGQMVLGWCAIVSLIETLHNIGRKVLLVDDEEAAGFPFL